MKPNLQIVADDVKCSHGCTVSDLEEEQLFYFRCAAAPLCVLLSSKAADVEQICLCPSCGMLTSVTRQLCYVRCVRISWLTTSFLQLLALTCLAFTRQLRW